ncbi:hypothetical protein TNCV_2896131 [Trichonephila clavipes]|nr:hypothetical protein TNCV_2896131 [Trichonephila clavipes]
MITSVRRLFLAYIDNTATHSPASESVDRRMNDISCESDEFLEALFADRWRNDSSEGFLAQPGSPNEVVRLSGGQNSRPSVS